mmetsp:Transcript_15967/g.30204  ORF Transcript_15967/g.30204 Transcript_15967/m.30204 type:complete len:152 (-) Transcript_15967:186-641(-)
MFKNNTDVAFGDINLSEDPIRGNHNPGMGGWPTIRYFNKKTGYEGGSYNKKTGKSMCDELGDNAYMRAYVEEYAGTSLCSTATGAGCTDKEKKYIAQWKERSLGDVDKQIIRLEKMAGKKMKSNLKKWINQRLAVLKQLKRAAEGAGKDEL